jgi:hypothetical protein
VDGGVWDEVLLLHGQEQDIRNQFVHLVNEEEQDKEELTIYGGRRPRDPQLMTKERADDGDSWGKRTAQPRRSATQKESRNGAAKQWLASGKGIAVAYLGIKKSCKKRGKLRSPAPFICGGERGLLAVPPVGIGAPVTCRSSWTTAWSPSPCPGHWPVALGRCFKHGASPNRYGLHCSPVRPANNCFSIFPI